MNQFDLNKKVVVITGGAGFLAKAFAEAILDSNGIVFLIDNNSMVLNDRVTFLKNKFGHNNVDFDFSDITDKTQVENAKDKLIKRFGRIDVLINNATNNPIISKNEKISYNGFESFKLSDWNNDIAVGLTGAFLSCQVFGTEMKKQFSGSIINISSDLGIISPDQRIYPDGFVKPISYSVVKTGILGLTRYLSTYWANYNILVNAICFGGVQNEQPVEFIRNISEIIPLKRMAKAEEYQGIIVFLCSAASSYITGATIIVDGGRSVW